MNYRRWLQCSNHDQYILSITPSFDRMKSSAWSDLIKLIQSTLTYTSVYKVQTCYYVTERKKRSSAILVTLTQRLQYTYVKTDSHASSHDDIKWEGLDSTLVKQRSRWDSLSRHTVSYWLSVCVSSCSDLSTENQHLQNTWLKIHRTVYCFKLPSQNSITYCNDK